ncbi:MAG: GHMP kinase [Chloroflexota bacterium]|nr:GHMP kinase [Chloroflexota bacterium]
MSAHRATAETEHERSVRVRVPVRVDFAGGWTDVHHYSAREGGAVVNAAINHYVEGHAVSSGDRMHLEYGLAVPKGSGLGTSAALDVAWLALTNALLGRSQSPVQVAEGAYRLEKLLGLEGGKQDQYASALGGFNHFVFGAEDEPALVEPLRLDAEIVRALEDRLVLCYTGSQRHSGSLHERVWGPFLDGDPRISASLEAIRDTAAATRDALLGGDLDTVGELMTANRESVRRMLPELVTPTMDRLFAQGESAGAIGSKACGAGGGGCLLFLCTPRSRQGVERVLADSGATVLPFRFEDTSYWGDRSAVGGERKP